MAGRERIGMWILSLRMLPPISIVVPFYLMLSRSGLLDTYAGMLLVYMSFSLPFAIWMLTGFFAEIPRSIDEAAAADGATPLQILFRFIVPIARGGISVTTIFTFVFAWNEFLFAFLLTKERWVTVPVRLGSTITPFQTDWGYLTAGAIMSFLPLVLDRLPAPAPDGARCQPGGGALMSQWHAGVSMRQVDKLYPGRRPEGARRRLARRRAGQLLLDSWARAAAARPRSCASSPASSSRAPGGSSSAAST